MVILKSCEILDELKKLGITATAEIMQYISEYTKYYARNDLTAEAQEE